MLLPPPKTGKSRARKLLDFVSSVNARLRAVFIDPPHRRARPGVYFCHHSLAGVQALEARLCLAPVANDDSYYANAMATTNIPAAEGVLANDTGSNLTAVLETSPAHGSLTLNSDGSFVYTNNMPMTPDTFTYEAYDGSSYSAAATVTLSISTNGAQPVAQADNGYQVVHDHTLTVSAPGVLGNDSDPNNLPLTAVLVTSTSHGSLSLNGDGSLSYTPDAHYVGSDSFQYYADNGYQASSTVTDTINVTNQAPVANNDHYYPLTSTYTVSAANGVLANDYDPDGDTLTTSLVSGPSHGSLGLNSDGSFSYTADPGFLGTDSFVYAASDGIASSDATVTLSVQYSVLSATDETKLPVDTIQVSRPILSAPFNSAIASPLPAGGSGGTSISAAPADGAPATAHNLSLIYNSVLSEPDQVIEVNIGLSTNTSTYETITATLTFNGVVQPAQYFTMASLDGTGSNVLLAQQVSTASLASGRYPWSMTVTSPNMQAPATVSGYVNVVNDSAGPFGQGWDMPGLLRLFNNTVSGVPDGVLLSTGDGNGWYFTQGTGNSYTSPNGPEAFSTLVSVSGGGWQLSDEHGTVYTFDSSGDLTSTELRTTATTTYGWTNGDLTSITDPFSRVVTLAHTNGLLSSITDYAGNAWQFSQTGGELTAITEPTVAAGSPVWQYAYSGGYMTSETDPDANESQFVLDNFHRLSQTTLPDSSTTADTSEQDFGSGSTNSSDPADLTLATSVTPSSTDGDGNTTAYQTDAFGDLISDTDAAGNTSTVARNANGRPTVVTLPPPATGDANPVTDIYYNSTGDETYATGAQPTYGTYAYTADSFGQWATFTDVTGNEWVRTFDSSGNILTETTPSGNEVAWTYNSYGQPLTMALPAPNNASGTVTVHYDYDADDRLIEILWPDGTSRHLGYNSDDYLTSSEDEDGNTTTAALDALNRAVSVTNAAEGVSSTTYDLDGNVLTTETPLGEVTSNEYNSMNELVQQTLPAPTTGAVSPVLAWTYNADDHELAYTDGLGRQVSYSYNALNEMTQETLPPPATGDAAPTIEYAYNNLGQQVSETNQLGGVSVTSYGNADIRQVTSVEQPPPSGSGTGPTTSYSYDTDGRQNVVTNALSQSTTTSFTADGQVSQAEDNLGNITSYVYGNGGELLSTTDPLSHTSSDEYDSRYRVIQTTDANGGVTQIGLDGVGNKVNLTDSDGNETDWTFNSLNLPLTETNALGTTTTGYNADAEVTSIEDADGRVRDFVYNADRELTAENWMSGGTIVATMAYNYDLGGQLTGASDANSAYAFAYNGDAQVTSVDNAGTPNVPDVVLVNTYDLIGNRTSQSATIARTADFLNSYSYNADQQLTAVTQQDVNGGNVVASKEADFAYNALGQVTDTWAYNTLGGPRTDVYHGAYGYDGDSRLTSLAYTSNAGATTIDSFGWTYNAASLVTSFTSNNGTASYAYDPTNQLTSAGYTTANGGNQPANESYSYTVNGNRNSTGYSTGSDNLITSDGTFNYQHDADGNTTVRTRISGAYAADYKTTFTWDYRNRLTDVDYYDNSDVLTKHVHYVYDVFNHLIATDVDSTGSGSYDIEQHDVLDVTPEVPLAGLPGMAPAPPVLEFDAGGALTDRVFEAMGRILAQGSVSSPTTADVPNWMLTNNQGSVVYVLDNTGAVVDQIVYNSFGAVAYESNPSVAHFAGYAGGHVDFFTGLVDDDNRWYDPIDAKWLSNDPAGFLAGDPDLSCYGLNDPTNRTDPTGLDSGPGVWDNFIYYASHPSAMPTSYYVGYVAAGAIAATAAAAAMAIWVSGMVAANAAAAAAGEAEAAAAKAGMQAAAKDAVMAEIGQGTFPGAIGPWNGPVWWNLPPNPLGPFGPGPFPLGPF